MQRIQISNLTLSTNCELNPLFPGQGKFDLSFIEPALQFCTHLIYKSAIINPETYKLTPLDETYDVTKNNYRLLTDLKHRFPGLKVLLAVGHNDDKENKEKYLTLVSDCLFIFPYEVLFKQLL